MPVEEATAPPTWGGAACICETSCSEGWVPLCAVEGFVLGVVNTVVEDIPNERIFSMGAFEGMADGCVLLYPARGRLRRPLIGRWSGLLAQSQPAPTKQAAAFVSSQAAFYCAALFTHAADQQSRA